MKIAVLCHLDYPIASPFAGGLESHTWHLCRTLLARGHQVTMFASGDSDSSLRVHSLVESGLQLKSSIAHSEGERIKQNAYRRALQYISRQDKEPVL